MEDQAASVGGENPFPNNVSLDAQLHRNVIPAPDAVHEYVFRSGGIERNVRFTRNVRPTFDRIGTHGIIVCRYRKELQIAKL